MTRSPGMFHCCTQKVICNVAMGTVGDYQEIPIVQDPSVVFIDDWEACWRPFWLTFAEKKAVIITHYKELTKTVVVHGLRQLEDVSFRNIVQKEVGTFDLAKANIDLLVIVEIEVWALIRDLFSRFFGQGWMIRLHFVVIRNLHRIVKGRLETRREHIWKDCWKNGNWNEIRNEDVG